MISKIIYNETYFKNNYIQLEMLLVHNLLPVHLRYYNS